MNVASPDEGSRSLIGRTIGNCRITAPLGAGGVGEVYLATDLMLDRQVAIKFLRPGLAVRRDVVRRFKSEARLLAQLSHPNVATLYSLHRDGDDFAMVMEHVDGQTLASLLRESGRLELAFALQIFFQALDGVGYAHEHGIVHRDVKTSNLMLSSGGVVKVMDFGIALALDQGRLTRDGHVVGTAQYMAPEQVRGLETDARADIYSLGIVLYEMLTGRVPFDSPNEYEVLRAQVEAEPASPASLAPELPDRIAGAILCALEKDPAYRFQTTREFREALAESVSSELHVVGPIESSALPTKQLRALPARPTRGATNPDTTAFFEVDAAPARAPAAATGPTRLVAPPLAAPARRGLRPLVPLAVGALGLMLASASTLGLREELPPPPPLVSARVQDLATPLRRLPPPLALRPEAPHRLPSPAGLPLAQAELPRVPRPKPRLDSVPAAPAQSPQDDGWVIRRH